MGGTVFIPCNHACDDQSHQKGGERINEHKKKRRQMAGYPPFWRKIRHFGEKLPFRGKQFKKANFRRL